MAHENQRHGQALTDGRETRRLEPKEDDQVAKDVVWTLLTTTRAPISVVQLVFAPTCVRAVVTVVALVSYLFFFLGCRWRLLKENFGSVTWTNT